MTDEERQQRAQLFESVYNTIYEGDPDYEEVAESASDNFQIEGSTSETSIDENNNIKEKKYQYSWKLNDRYNTFKIGEKNRDLTSKEKIQYIDPDCKKETRAILETKLKETASLSIAYAISQAVFNLKTELEEEIESGGGGGGSEEEGGGGSGGGSITVDAALSTTSTNPVQNKVITAAINEKVDLTALSPAALSGDYNDLINTPDLTVNPILSSGTKIAELTIGSTTFDIYAPAGGGGGGGEGSEIEIIDNLQSTSTTAALSANQGKVLSDLIGSLEDLDTSNKNDLVAAINEIQEAVNLLVEIEDGTLVERIQGDWNESDPSSLSYIKNKPSIPAKTSDLINDSGFITAIEGGLDYNDLLNTPKNLSDFNNDLGFIDESDLSQYVKKSELSYDSLSGKPENLSDFNNDLGFIDESGLSQYVKKSELTYESLSGKPENLSDFNNDLGFIDESGLSQYVKKSELSYDDLSGKPENLSDFNNDLGFIDESGLSQYVKKSELSYENLSGKPENLSDFNNDLVLGTVTPYVTTGTHIADITIGEGEPIELYAPTSGGGSSVVVIDNLNSSSSTDALSAAQGKYLASQIALLMNKAEVMISASPSIIELGGTTNVTFTGKLRSESETVTADTLELKDSNGNVLQSGTNTTQVSTTIELTSSKTITAVATLSGGTVLSKEVTVNAVHPVYSGFGVSYSSVTGGKKLNPLGNYTGTATTNGVKFYIIVPSDSSAVPTNFTMNATPFVMNSSSVVIDGLNYTVFESGSTFNSGATVNIETK